jgi:hypothetical protein
MCGRNFVFIQVSWPCYGREINDGLDVVGKTRIEVRELLGKHRRLRKKWKVN